MPNSVVSGLGWRPDLADYRDYSPDSPPVRELLGNLKRSRSKRTMQVDLRESFPDAYDQQHLNSSPSHACAGLVEYFERRSHGTVAPPSRLFHYKSTRRLLNRTSENGCGLRAGMKVIRRCGLPPERFYPYDVEKLEDDPDAFLYSFADEYRSLCYVRLDSRHAAGDETLEVVKLFLAAGFPSVFGFPVPSSISQECDIPYRPTFDSIIGGQAAIAVGFDDRRLRSAGGSLLIRNSWGAAWGEEGYGWLPYAYIEERLATDFWTILKPDWIASGEFKRPRLPS